MSQHDGDAIFVHLYWVKHNNRVKDWLVLNKTFKSNEARWSMIRNISCNEMKQVTPFKRWKQTRFTRRSTSQHRTTWWLDQKLVRKRRGLRVQHGPLYWKGFIIHTVCDPPTTFSLFTLHESSGTEQQPFKLRKNFGRFFFCAVKIWGEGLAIHFLSTLFFFLLNEIRLCTLIQLYARISPQ